LRKKTQKKKTEPDFLLDEVSNLPDELLLLPIKVRPVFPGVITPLVVSPGKFTNTVDEVYKNHDWIGLALLVEDDNDENSARNIYKIGVIARILKKINLPEGGSNILINTVRRFKVDSIKKEEPFVVSKVSYPDEYVSSSKSNIKALMRTLILLTKEFSENNPLFTDDMKVTLVNMNEPGRMADFVCSILNLEKEEYQSVLETDDITMRLENVILFMKKELELLSLQKKINDQINDKLDKQQRQFYLREQLKVIQGELGVNDEKPEKKYELLLEKLTKLNVDPTIISEVSREIEKLSFIDANSGDYNVIRNYLDIIDSLPWEEPTPKDINLNKAKRILDRDHYKLEDIKQRILEFLAVKKLNPQNAGTILCFVGPPGVGKTSIARSVAESLGKKFYRISLGGIRDEAEIKGHRRTYIGAMPGKILTALRMVKEKDPVILLDEIDKLHTGSYGDPSSALLEVLDPEQNKTFRDHYLDLPFDLSSVLFIATANTMDTIPGVLADRMDVIRLSGYITEEKAVIFKKYLWDKIKKKVGIANTSIKLDDKAIIELIESYSRESGLRNLERCTEKIARKLAFKIVKKQKFTKTIKAVDIKTYLGNPIYIKDKLTKTTQPGMSMGLAWTGYGGATLLIETVFIKGKEGLELTGKLGGVMNESATIALNHIKYLINDNEYFQGKSLHIHIPDGATPKDGPSAGITLASSILSLLINQTIEEGLAMTGELTLTGEVLGIGGLKEKIVAARRSGVIKIILPKENESSLKEIPQYLKKGIKFYLVDRFSEVIKILFGSTDIKKLIKKNK
jgi:ATP-dependent Lon protease